MYGIFFVIGNQFFVTFPVDFQVGAPCCVADELLSECLGGRNGNGLIPCQESDPWLLCKYENTYRIFWGGAGLVRWVSCRIG